MGMGMGMGMGGNKHRPELVARLQILRLYLTLKGNRPSYCIPVLITQTSRLRTRLTLQVCVDGAREGRMQDVSLGGGRGLGDAGSRPLQGRSRSGGLGWSPHKPQKILNLRLKMRLFEKVSVYLMYATITWGPLWGSTCYPVLFWLHLVNGLLEVVT